MANEWTYAALASWETSARTKDAPLFFSQAIPRSPSTVKWSEESAGQVGSTDRTLTGYPASRAYDGFAHLVTKHDATADDVWYLVFDFGAGGIEFDCLASIGDNWGTLEVDAVTLELDNGSVSYPTAPSSPDGTFANVVSIPFVSSPSDDNRRIALSLDHTGASATYRYSGVRYARIKIAKTGTSITPEIAELFFGRSRQLKNEPRNPFDPTSLRGESDTSRSRSGVAQKVIHHQGRFDLDAKILTGDSSEISAIVSWFESIRSVFGYVYKPTSAPGSWHLMFRETEDLSLPSVAGLWAGRETTIAASEQGPERLFLSRET